MKDTGQALQTLYSSLLSGITYNGKAVPFFTEEPFSAAPDYYIVFSGTDSTDQSNDNRFVHDVVVTLDIVTKTNMKNTRAAADAISNSILAILFPNSYVDRSTTDFTVMIRTMSSPGYLRDVDGSANIVRKILRITNHLIQK